LVGPASDPAGVKNQGNDIVKAMTAIANSKSTFISRGDNSGTNVKELDLWKAANITPSGDWYISAGTGMGAVLTMANEKNAYTLSDRGTYLSSKSKIASVIVCEKDTKMLNPYGVIVVNPKKNDKINEKGARAFADWIVSSEGQELIKNYGVDKYGQALFVPSAKK
jgi:tungstate transport system substrate-binding protein